MGLLVFLFWLFLNGRLTAETVLLGVGIALLALLFAFRACGWSWRKETALYRSLPWILSFLFTLIREIVKANLRMLPLVFGGKPDPVVCHIKTGLRTRLGRMLLSNAITLTPGTITLDCGQEELTVHCLTPALASELAGNAFEDKLRRIEVAFHG